jgi:hypothetical protein
MSTHIAKHAAGAALTCILWIAAGSACNTPAPAADGANADANANACKTEHDCADDSVCWRGACVAPTPCEGDSQCKPQGGVCDREAKRCVECVAATDCPSTDTWDGGAISTHACLGHTCVRSKSCESSRDCDAAQLCVKAEPPKWPVSFMGHGCAACGADADCPIRTLCKDNTCARTCDKEALACGTHGPLSCGDCPASETCAATGAGCFRSLGEPPSGVDELVATPEAVYVRGPYGVSRIDRATREARHFVRHVDVSALAANRSHVFFWTQGEISKHDQIAGTTEALARPNGKCTSLAADDGNVYCIAADTTGVGLYQFAVGGGDPLTLARRPEACPVSALVARGPHIYWACSGEGGFVAKSKTGTPGIQILWSGNPAGLAADDEYVYWGMRHELWGIPVGGGRTELIATLLTLPPNTIAPMLQWRLGSGPAGTIYVALGNALLRVKTWSGKVSWILDPKDATGAPFAREGGTLFVSRSNEVVLLREP